MVINLLSLISPLNNPLRNLLSILRSSCCQILFYLTFCLLLWTFQKKVNRSTNILIFPEKLSHSQQGQMNFCDHIKCL